MKMKRNLIAVAAAGLASAAMVTPAMADATAYGRVQVEVASYSNQTESTACDAPTGAGDSNGTACDGIALRDRAMGRVGVKATEDLGNGWKGLAKVELSVDTAAVTGVGGREALVGLKSDAVTVELGTLKSAYKYTGGVKYDPFVATTLEARRDNGGMRHGAYGAGSFLSESIAVKGKAGPIKYWVTYGPGENDGAMTASVMFSQGAVEAFVAMADSGDRLADPVPTNPQEESNTKIGGAYKMGATKIKLQYEMVDRDNSRDETYTFLGVEHKMGKNIIVAQLGMYDADMLTLGVIHKFTKMTRVFAGFRTSDADNESDEDVISVGLRKDF